MNKKYAMIPILGMYSTKHIYRPRQTIIINKPIHNYIPSAQHTKRRLSSSMTSVSSCT